MGAARVTCVVFARRSLTLEVFSTEHEQSRKVLPAHCVGVLARDFFHDCSHERETNCTAHGLPANNYE